MIFIIDDEIEVANTLSELLKTGLGLDSKIFTNLDDCIHEIDSGVIPRLIISDILMPTGSGLRLNTLISKRDLNIPLVFISGHADKIAQEDIILLRKPVNKERLFDVVNSILPDKLHP